MAKALDPIRKEMIFQLKGGNAHAPLEKAVANFPAKFRGVAPGQLPYSCWQLLEHIRLAQADMLEFCRSRKYQSKKWPDEYWPKSPSPAKVRDWEESIRQIKADRNAFIKLLSDSQTDLFAPFPWGEGQNLFHEACLIVDHNSYHLGEIVTIRRLLGIWPSPK